MVTICLVWHMPTLYAYPPKTKERFQQHIATIYANRSFSSEEKKSLKATWYYYYYNPIALDIHNKDALNALLIVSPTQILRLLEYIEKYGALASLYELQAVPSWDIVTIKLIEPFIQVQQPWRVRAQQTTASEELTVYFTPKKFFQRPPENHSGNPATCLVRYQVKKPNVYKLGFIASKAPNEPFCWNDRTSNMYGPLSYWAGYFMVEKAGQLQKLILGDYQVGLGQGLIHGHTFSMDKSQEVIFVMKSAYQGIKPSTSFQRKDGFRGIACTLQKNYYELLLYASLRKLDLTLHQKKNEPLHIETLATRGIAYTSLRQLENRNSVQERVVGAALTYKDPSNPSTVGVQAFYCDYSVPLTLGKKLPHTYFFQGKQNANIGIFGTHIWRNFHFFGEIACSQNKSIASIIGAMTSLGKKTDAACLLYRYPPHFHSLYGNAFGKKGAYNRNKQGLYLGVQYKPATTLSLKSYVDFGQYFVVEKTIHQAPTHQQEIMACAIYKPTRPQNFTLTLKASRSPKNGKGSKLDAPLLTVEKKGKLTFKASYPLKKGYDAYTQLQLSCLQKDVSQPLYGAGLKQFFHYKNQTTDLKWWATLYHTQNYHTAIRLYTHSLRGGMSYPPRYGNFGFEVGVLFRYRITKNVRIALGLTFNRFLYTGNQNSDEKRRGLTVSMHIRYKNP